MVAARSAGGYTSLWAGGAVAAGLILCTVMKVSGYDRMLMAENGGRELAGAALLGGAAMLLSLIYLFFELGFHDRNWSRGRVALIWGGIAVATAIWMPVVALVAAANLVLTLLGTLIAGRWMRGSLAIAASAALALAYARYG